MHRNSTTVSTKQERIAALAKQSPEMAFTSLAYLMDIDWLKEAYRRTRKDGAVGVDGVTAEEYEQDLEGNLQSLLDRAKSGTYKAPPVRRVHIPKGGSSTETRPLGIPTLEDKLLQRAVVMLLEPIYEQDFLDCSYGFRPGRSAHDALTSFRAVCHNILDFSARVVATVVAPPRPPHMPGDSDGSRGVNGCGFEIPVAILPSRRRPRAQVCHRQSDSSTPWSSVQACRQ